MVRSSRLAHDGSTLLPRVTDPGLSRTPLAVLPICTASFTCSLRLPHSILARTAPVSSGPGTRSARGNAERRSARSRHSEAGCNHAPRPGSRRRGSGVRTPSTTTTRNRPSTTDRLRHPTQVRTGPAADRGSGVGVGRAGAEFELGAEVECSAAVLLVPPSRGASRISRPTPTLVRPQPPEDRRRCGCRSSIR
jgi:hypothetical protein